MSGSGWLMVKKPSGISSNQCLNRVKRLLKVKKAGHAGTLDPLASGLLPMAFGDATRFIQYVMAADKHYTAWMYMGLSSETGDIEGRLFDASPLPAMTKAYLNQRFSGFLGEQPQTPPMYSALKYQGKPLYEYARRGEVLERAPRRIAIYSLEILDVQGHYVKIAVHCSKGTYVRTLIEDMGKLLGCGAHMVSLVRTQVGNFAAGVSLAELEACSIEERWGCVESMDSVLSMPKCHLEEHETQALYQGREIYNDFLNEGLHALYDKQLGFLGVGEAIARQLRVVRLLPARCS